MEFAFEPGKAYWFNRCSGGKKFLAVAAERKGDVVEFVKPIDVLTGEPYMIEGREVMRVVMDDGEYMASAAAPDKDGAARVLEEIRRNRAELRRV